MYDIMYRVLIIGIRDLITNWRFNMKYIVSSKLNENINGVCGMNCGQFCAGECGWF